MNQLTDLKVLITGASRGVGFAITQLLLKEGAWVLGIARDAERLAVAEEQHQSITTGSFTSLCCDLGEKNASEVIAQKVESLWGRLDLLINNAGVMLHHEGGLLEEPRGLLEQTLQLNLLAPYEVSRALLPLLHQGKAPRIVHVSSGAGTLAGLKEPGIASYRLSKWAMNGMVLLQAEELRGKVSVLAFDPGWVKTDLGGPHAPGTVEEAAQGLKRTLQLPWETTGEFVKDGKIEKW
ncbi:MAG: SDR family NAD(P)-dependent oxidoreductase [Polyangiaceae bacterium]|nr:SDR family NAD(P)-dependent oxidoreductase [Polyangiaceae bacterium]